MGAYSDYEVDTDYFTDNNAYGGSGGSKVDYIKDDNGAIMTKFEGWRQDWRIRGIKATFSDGSTFQIGDQAGEEYQYINISPGELITRLNIQPSGEKSSGGYYRLGAVWFQTDKGQEFGIFSKNLEDDTANWVEVGSGMCCGIFGAGGDDVDRLGMAMLRDVSSATLDNVTYPNLDLKVVATTPDLIKNSTYTNDTSVQQSQTMSYSNSCTKETTWSTSTTIGFEFSVSVSAGIPLVVDVDTNASWGVSSESSHSVSTTNTDTLTWTWPILVPPHTIVHATGEVWSDAITTPYTGTMNCLLINGKTYSYPVSGTYTGADYARNDCVTTETPITEVPEINLVGAAAKSQASDYLMKAARERRLAARKEKALKK